MATTIWRTHLLFGLCFLVMIRARLVTRDYSSLLSRLYKVSNKDKQPVLLILDHHHGDSKTFDSLEHRDKHAHLSFLHGLDQNEVFSDRHLLLHTKNNGLKFKQLFQENLNEDNNDDTRYRHEHSQLDRVRDRKNRYKLDQDGNQENKNNNRNDKYKGRQDRNRGWRHRSKQARIKNQQDSNRYQEYRQDQDANQINKYKNLINRYQQKPHQQFSIINDWYDKSQPRLEREDRHDREAERDINKYFAEDESQYLQNKYKDRERGHQIKKKYRYDRQRDQDRYVDDKRDIYIQQDSQQYNDRKDRSQSQRAPSPVMKSLLRMSNSFRCGARDQCQDECDSKSVEEQNSCEEKCEEKYECDEESGEKNSCEDECEDEVTGSTKGTLVEK